MFIYKSNPATPYNIHALIYAHICAVTMHVCYSNSSSSRVEEEYVGKVNLNITLSV